MFSCFSSADGWPSNNATGLSFVDTSHNACRRSRPIDRKASASASFSRAASDKPIDRSWLICCIRLLSALQSAIACLLPACLLPAGNPRRSAQYISRFFFQLDYPNTNNLYLQVSLPPHVCGHQLQFAQAGKNPWACC